MALWNLHHHWQNPYGGSFQFIDYQFPLQTQNAEKRVGNVDLVGISDKGNFILTELKFRRNNDKPISALLQVLRYAAIVDANMKRIVKEARKKKGVELEQALKVVQILADTKWWKHHDFDFTVPSKSQVQFGSLIDWIKKNMGISVECLAFDNLEYPFSFNGERPILDPIPTMVAVPLR
ncbi:MAG: hypothetical protein V6Z81_08060 [Parvularculales bacterium]